MRILIDECAPRALKKHLIQQGHECRTVQEAGWSGKENGELLSLAETAFDVLVTVDTNLRYQQNLKGRKIAIVVLGNSAWRMVRVHLDRIAAIVNEATPGSYTEVDVPFV